MAERQQAGIADEDVEAGDHHDVDEHLDHGAIESPAAELIGQGGNGEQQHGQDDRRRYRSPHDR
jgi:hypothetical protein